MAYEIEEIRLSQQIFYYLLEHFELREEASAGLYRAYVENEQVQLLVKSQGEEARSSIERYGDVIYLIPKEENVFLGFSKAKLKEILCKSGGTDKDFYLSQFVILTLLSEFYDGQGASAKSRDYIRVGELQNCVTDRLKMVLRTPPTRRRKRRGWLSAICRRHMSRSNPMSAARGHARQRRDFFTIFLCFSRIRA